ASACGGGAALTKLGRRPPLVSPYNVNCDTDSTAPRTSRIEWLSFPCSSSKMRRCAIFSASVFASASVSSVDTPTSTAYPSLDMGNFRAVHLHRGAHDPLHDSAHHRPPGKVMAIAQTRSVARARRRDR